MAKRRIENTRALKAAAIVVIAIAAFFYQQWSRRHAERSQPAPVPASIARDSEISQLARDRRSNIVVESSGTITKVLPDDRSGDQHQRFIVRLADDNTILIAHNVDLAPRAPVKPGDIIQFRGEYEWNDQGGVVHWTHKDPRNRHPAGWIKLNDRTYQ